MSPKRILISMAIIGYVAIVAVAVIFAVVETPATGRRFHETKVLFYDESAGDNGSIVFNYNLSDPLYWREIVEPPCFKGCRDSLINDSITEYRCKYNVNNCQAGDPDLFYNESEDAYYILFRYKTPSRFKYLVLIKSKDLETWSEVWNVSAETIKSTKQYSDINFVSLEKTAIAEHNRWYYMHIAVDTVSGDEGWRNAYVQSKTLAGLGEKVANLSYWHKTYIPGLNWSSDYQGKFNNILYHNGLWYYLKKKDVEKGETPYSILVSTNASGPWSNLSDPAQLYCDNFDCDAGPVRVFTILRDVNGKYIYWSSYTPGIGDRAWWWWAVSDDLVNWSFVERKGPLGVKGQWRFWDFGIDHATGNEIAVAQMSIGQRKSDSIVLWTFPK